MEILTTHKLLTPLPQLTKDLKMDKPLMDNELAVLPKKLSTLGVTLARKKLSLSVKPQSMVQTTRHLKKDPVRALSVQEVDEVIVFIDI